MTEPNNPLFEDEKEFLERKKLEYERALRGDVEEIKEQTIHAGKLALVGAGIAGGIWLIAKAFGGRKAKKKHKKHKYSPSSFEDYAGFDGFEDDSHDQELDSLATAYNSPEYAYDHADRFGEDDGFYQEGNASDYFQNQDQDEEGETDADDNGLGDYPDFPAHSSSQHGADTSADVDTDTTYGSHADVYHTDEDLDAADDNEDEGPAHSFASPNSYQARPYDDSRRLPESNSFAEPEEEYSSAASAAEAPEPKKPWLIPAVVAFAKTETGKVIVAQVAAVAMGLITRKIKDILPGSEAKTGKNADLAHSSALAGASPATWPATTAAQDVSAAAHHDDTITPREPLA